MTVMVHRCPPPGDLMNQTARGDRTGFSTEPVFVEDRPQRLVEILAVLEERPPQHAFLHGADLAKRAVAASVLQRGPRLEPVDAHRFEREPNEELGAVDERAGSPERRTESKSPLRRPETGFEL